MVRIAVAAGAVAVIATVAVLVVAFVKGPRPEEDVARRYLEAAFAGDAPTSYELTTPAYQLLVLLDDQRALVSALHLVAGDDVTLRVLGSERTIGSQPPESLVGYTGDTAAGAVEGVVTLFEVEGGWRVADAGYRFTEASDEELAPFEETIRRLDQQVEQRARQLGGSPGPTDLTTDAPR